MAISRKQPFLYGTGAAFALPLLDAMTPAFATGAARPTRLGFFQVPNGIMNLQNEFSPKAVGDLELTPILQPLADFKDRLLVFSGLDSQQAAGLGFEIAGDHPRACTAWLTGTHAKMTAGADLHAGVSVDQIAAREFGKETQLASLEVGLENSEVVGSCEAAYSCAYFNTISWRDESTPMPMESRPRALFERLFGAAGTDPKVRQILRQEDRSILDAVNEDVKRLRIKLGGPDRGKICGTKTIAAILRLTRSMAMTCPLRSTGITPLPRYYEAVRPSPAHRYFRPRGWHRLHLSVEPLPLASHSA
jgi:hypothetical protein